jgi:diacylglycerol kinase (ATP)
LVNDGDFCDGRPDDDRSGRRSRLERHAGDWCWIILAISIVSIGEALNTAFEFLADAASPAFHPLVRNAKDVAAGAVLITALAAAIIGALVFWPYVTR